MSKKGIVSEPLEQSEKKHTCSKCGSSDISFSLALEDKKRGLGEGCFLTTVVVILLLCIPVIGWILLFAMFFEKKGTVNVTYALCNNCGNSWKIEQQDSKKHKKTKKSKKNL